MQRCRLIDDRGMGGVCPNEVQVLVSNTSIKFDLSCIHIFRFSFIKAVIIVSQMPLSKAARHSHSS